MAYGRQGLIRMTAAETRAFIAVATAPTTTWGKAVTGAATRLYEHKATIHSRTADRLRTLGLVTIAYVRVSEHTSYHHVELTDYGRAILTQLDPSLYSGKGGRPCPL